MIPKFQPLVLGTARGIIFFSTIISNNKCKVETGVSLKLQEIRPNHFAELFYQFQVFLEFQLLIPPAMASVFLFSIFFYIKISKPVHFCGDWHFIKTTRNQTISLHRDLLYYQRQVIFKFQPLILAKAVSTFLSSNFLVKIFLRTGVEWRLMFLLN